MANKVIAFFQNDYKSVRDDVRKMTGSPKTIRGNVR